MTIIGEEMKPCPFCGSGGVYPQKGFLNASRSMVWCASCGAKTAEYENDDEAIAGWNTRSPEAVTDEMREAGADHIGGGSTFDRDERLEMAEEIYEAMRDAALLKVTR